MAGQQFARLHSPRPTRLPLAPYQKSRCLLQTQHHHQFFSASAEPKINPSDLHVAPLNLQPRRLGILGSGQSNEHTVERPQTVKTRRMFRKKKLGPRRMELPSRRVSITITVKSSKVLWLCPPLHIECPSRPTTKTVTVTSRNRNMTVPFPCVGPNPSCPSSAAPTPAGNPISSDLAPEVRHSQHQCPYSDCLNPNWPPILK